MSRVAVIGGGPSGITAAKAALECGLAPTIFERSDSLGGLWRPSSGSVWSGMSANLSRHTCAFSDFLWEDDEPDFPSAIAVWNYLERYCRRFKLLDCFRPTSEVQSLERAGRQWFVTWGSEDGQVHRDGFDHVVVSTGIFSKAFQPSISGVERFRGSITHSGNYRDPEPFRGKKVLIVGAAFSGADIASDISTVADKVFTVIRRPMWFVPRNVPDPDTGNTTRLDRVLFRRSDRDKMGALSAADRNRHFHRLFEQLGGNPGAVCPKLHVDVNSPALPYLSITDHFLLNIQNGRIAVHACEIQRFDTNAVFLSDGSSHEIDAVVFCTGYETALSLFREPESTILDFQSNDRFMPLCLDRCTFHPDIEDLAFIGLYRGPFFGVMELQARWAAMVFSRKIAPPDHQACRDGRRHALELRAVLPRPQFPYGDYVGLADSIASEIDVLPDLSKNQPLHDELWHGQMVPAHYRLRGFAANPVEAEKAIRQACSI